MKNKIFLFIGFLLVYCNTLSSKENVPAVNTGRLDSLNIVCSRDLSTLTSKWAEEFNKINPDMNIKVTSLSESNSTAFYSGGSLGFVSRNDFSALNNEAIWKVVVGRDVLLPIINSNNPFIDEIAMKGLSSDELAMIFADPSKTSWGSLFGAGQEVPVKCYLMNDDLSRADIAKFLNSDQGVINGIEVESSAAIVSAVQNDPLAIGFCKLSDILETVNQQIVGDVKLMPIDRNANDKIDYSENIYQDVNSFTRGVWIGKYPKALYSSIYSVSAIKPVNEREVAFLKWVLTDGQQYVALNGYSDLAIHERQSKVDDLNLSGIELVAANTERSNLKLILLILGLTIVFSFALEAVFRYRKTINVSHESSVSFSQTAFNENSLSLPAGLYFDKSHTWAFMEKDGMVKIGIDDFLQHVTGSITQIKMKKPGDKVTKGEQVMSIIQKGKQLNIYSPVSGTIKEHNESLNEESSLLNSSPYAEGWIYSIEPTNWLREIQFLFMAEKYKMWIKDEFTRLRDFLATFVKPGTLEYSHVILQDGGELKDNLLSELGPEAWDDFQTNFLDTSK